MTQKAVTLLSTGLCIASLAPLVSCSRAVCHGYAEGANDGVQRQQEDGRHRGKQQHREERSGVHGSRRRNRSPPPPPPQPDADRGMFNSFSLEEHEPSSYGFSTGPSNAMNHQQQRRQQHERQEGLFADASAGYDFSYNNTGEEEEEELSSADDPYAYRQQQQQYCFDDSGEDAHADASEFCTAAAAAGHRYYPGRGRNAVQNLANSQGLDPSFFSNNAVKSFPRQRHQSYFFSGLNPYGASSSSSSSSGSSNTVVGGIRRRQRQRQRQASGPTTAVSSRFPPTLPPAVTSAAAAAAAALVKIMAATGLALALLAPLATALASHWAYFVAGGICAAISHTAAVPLDVIKTRIQCAPAGVEYRGTLDALVKICKSEGTGVLFCGAGATLVGYALQGSLKFGFFEFLKPVFTGLFVRGGAAAAAAASSASAPALGILIAASVTAEIVGSSALTPLEAARIRMVADADYAPGLRSGIARMISEEGVGSLARGLPAVLAKQIPYTVTKLVSFDYLVRTLASKSGCGGGRGVGVTVLCAVIAGVMSSLASQPGDSLLSALNSEGRSAAGAGSSGSSTSTIDAFNELSYVSSEEEEDMSGSDSCSSEDQTQDDVSCFSSVISEERIGVRGATADATAAAAVAQESKVAAEPVARAMARIAREAGLRGLFRGTGARMIHVTSIVTVQLLIYQSIKKMVGIDS